MAERGLQGDGCPEGGAWRERRNRIRVVGNGIIEMRFRFPLPCRTVPRRAVPRPAPSPPPRQARSARTSPRARASPLIPHQLLPLPPNPTRSLTSRSNKQHMSRLFAVPAFQNVHGTANMFVDGHLVILSNIVVAQENQNPDSGASIPRNQG